MISLEFLTAGRAIFTVSNGRGEHYTYRFTRKRPEDQAFAATVLAGTDNTAFDNYRYVAHVRSQDLKFPVSRDQPQHTKVLAWALQVIRGVKPLPPGYKIEHAGRCGKCGRLLTDPTSIEAGLGPKCRGKQ